MYRKLYVNDWFSCQKIDFHIKLQSCIHVFCNTASVLKSMSATLLSWSLFLVSLSLSLYIYTLYDFYEYQSLWLVLISLLAHLYYYHAIVIKRKRLTLGNIFVIIALFFLPLNICTIIHMHTNCLVFLRTFSCIY